MNYLNEILEAEFSMIIEETKIQFYSFEIETKDRVPDRFLQKLQVFPNVFSRLLTG